ncbi:hypothetical protein HNR46_003609 [Haloferula luteola]|uniref:DUF4340 domain-containing protein n=1 Tax=Haloferula luteola TaxID=595692 RepID=A0A840V6Q9_9BACT|nr:DUF4340 domain-containing protein [Haloferula luteola]MBB5353353.1 hypothetical protein [Haloferula luteola]
MSKKQVLILWILAAVLVVSLVAVKSAHKESFESATARDRGDTLLESFPAENVAKILITRGEEKVTLEKKDGTWSVAERDAYPANTTNINDLLRTLAEVKVTQGIEADPSFAPRFGMDPQADDDEEKGTDLLLSDASGKEVAHLTFGKTLEAASDPSNPFGGGSSGRFVLNHADESGVYVTSEVFPTITVMVERWLDDSFLKIEKIRSVEVSKPGEENVTAWKVSRDAENANFSLIGKQENDQLDETAFNPLKNLFSYARFEDVLPANKAESSWHKDQRQTAVIETFEGLTYHITFGPLIEEPQETEAGTPPPASYGMSVTVTGDIAQERKKAEGETEDAAKQADEAFAERKKTLEENLATARTLEGRVYKVSKYTVDPLLKDRTAFIKTAPPAGGTAPAGAPNLSRPGRPVQAVTPPIQIPPMPPANGE